MHDYVGLSQIWLQLKCIEIYRIMQGNAELTKEAATALVVRGTTQADNGMYICHFKRNNQLQCKLEESYVARDQKV